MREAGDALRRNIMGASVFLVPLECYLRGTKHRLALATEPFAFRDVAHFAAFAESALFEEWAEDLAAAHHVRLFALAFVSQQYVVSRKPLPGVADLDGVRLAGPSASWFRPLGAITVMMPTFEIGNEAKRAPSTARWCCSASSSRARSTRPSPSSTSNPWASSPSGFSFPSPSMPRCPRGQRERLASAAREGGAPRMERRRA